MIIVADIVNGVAGDVVLVTQLWRCWYMQHVTCLSGCGAAPSFKPSAWAPRSPNAAHTPHHHGRFAGAGCRRPGVCRGPADAVAGGAHLLGPGGLVGGTRLALEHTICSIHAGSVQWRHAAFRHTACREGEQIGTKRYDHDYDRHMSETPHATSQYPGPQARLAGGRTSSPS